MPLRSAVILVAILAIFADPSAAQSVTGGAKVGVNFSKLVFGEVEGNLDRKTGLIIGAFANFPMTDLFSFHPELLYTMKGAKDERVAGDVKTNLDFIQFPLLFRATFAEFNARPFVVFGPAFGFRTTADIEGPSGNEVNIRDAIEVFEFSGVIGGGVQFGMVIVEARYDYGFNDLDKNEPAELRTRTFSILVGFDFARFRNP